MNSRVCQYDSIRFWSTFFIIVCHFNAYITNNHIGDGKGIFQVGFKSGDTTAMAVSIFFILSGASLMLVYGEKDFNIGQYYKKRFLAVYPWFWVAWLSVYIYTFATGNLKWHFRDIHFPYFFFTLLGVDGYVSEVMKKDNFYLTGEWFLGSLILIYCIFPLLLYLRRKNIVIFIAFLVIAYFIGCNIWRVGLNPYTFPPTRLVEFGFGMLFSEMRNSDKIPKFVKVTFSLVCAIMLLILYFVHFPFFYMHVYVALGISSFVTFYNISTWLCKLKIYNAMCTNFSKFSFGAFLIHHHVLGDISSKYFGIPILRRQMYALFFVCFVIIVLLTYYLNKLVTPFRKKISELISLNAKVGIGTKMISK